MPNRRQVRRRILGLVDEASTMLEDGRGRVAYGVCIALGIEQTIANVGMIEEVLIELGLDKLVWLHGAGYVELDKIDQSTIRHLTMVSPRKYQPKPLAIEAGVSSGETNMNRTQMRKRTYKMLADTPDNPVFADRQGRVSHGILKALGILRPSQAQVTDILRVIREMHHKQEWIADFGAHPGSGSVYKLERGPKFCEPGQPRNPEADAAIAAAERPTMPETMLGDNYAAGARAASAEAKLARTSAGIKAGHDMGNTTGGATTAGFTADEAAPKSKAAWRSWQPRLQLMRARYIVWAVDNNRRDVKGDNVGPDIAAGMGLDFDDRLVNGTLSQTLKMMEQDGQVLREMGAGGKRTISVQLVHVSVVELDELRRMVAANPLSPVPRKPKQPASPTAQPAPPVPASNPVDRSDPGELNLSAQGRQLLLDAAEAIAGYDELRERFAKLSQEYSQLQTELATAKAAATESESAKRARQQQDAKILEQERLIAGLKDELAEAERERRAAGSRIAELERQLESQQVVDLTDRQKRALTSRVGTTSTKP